MKKLFTLVITMIIVVTTNAQSTVYKKSDLKKMSKMTLTEVYLNEVTKLLVNAPYTSFTLFGNAVTDTDSTNVNSKLDVPASEYFESKRSNTFIASNVYNDLVRKEILEIIPYCDKADIITSIVYLQKVNNNIKVQVKGKKFVIQRLAY